MAARPLGWHAAAGRLGPAPARVWTQLASVTAQLADGRRGARRAGGQPKPRRTLWRRGWQTVQGIGRDRRVVVEHGDFWLAADSEWAGARGVGRDRAVALSERRRRHHDQGITRAGNRHVRRMIVQLAWSWLRYQPTSALSRWYRERFDQSRRLRRIGIVALARKLLIALWRYLGRGRVPEGAMLKPPVGIIGRTAASWRRGSV